VGLKTRLEQVSLKVKLIPTSGSTENLEYLSQGKADFAFYQGGTSLEASNVRSVANIYSEVVHIIVKRSLSATSLSHLLGKRISIGPKKSGTMIVARQILEHYGLEGKIEEKHFSFGDVLAHFEPDLDAAFIVSGIPSPVISELLRNPDYTLLPIESGKALQYRYSSLFPFEIPKGVYGESPSIPYKDLPTVATSACLVVRRDVPDMTIKTLLRELLQPDFRNRFSLLELTPAFAQTDIDFALHPGAESYYLKGLPFIPMQYTVLIERLRVAAVALAGLIIMYLRLINMVRKERFKKMIQSVVNIHRQVFSTTDNAKLKELKRKAEELKQEAFSRFSEKKVGDSSDFYLVHVIFQEMSERFDDQIPDD